MTPRSSRSRVDIIATWLYIFAGLCGLVTLIVLFRGWLH